VIDGWHAEGHARSGLDDELRLLARAERHDLDLPDAHVVRARGSASRRGSPSRASQLARRAAPGDHRRAEGGQRVIGEKLQALRELAVRERAQRPEIEAESTASCVTPIGRTPSSSIRATCDGRGAPAIVRPHR
jgi:hypothetical protein